MEKMIHFIPLAMMGAIGVGLFDLYTLPGRVGQPATVIFSPWTSSATAIAKSIQGARLLQTARLPFAVTVVPDRSDYARIAKRNGAWFVASFAARAGCAFSKDVRD